MNPIVSFEKVWKRFGYYSAVQELDLSIKAGEFVTLLGPSGCGKSTTLRMLGGFEYPDEGRILLNGADVSRVPPNVRDVNMVFQDYALFPHLDVLGNVSFGLQYRGIPREEIAAKARSLLALVELKGIETRYPHQLSGGQRQRVALARALAPNPSLLLLDEPLGALDARLRKQMQRELKELQRKTGKTFLFVTHDQEEALTMSDTVVVMDGGRIQQSGTPQEIYRRPNNQFVATFIGETNLLPATVESIGGGELSAGTPDGKVRALLSSGSSAEVGEERMLSVRAEEIACTKAKPDSDNCFPGTIIRQVFKGSQIEMIVQLGSGVEVSASISPLLGSELAVNDQVWVGWQARDTVLLN